MIKVEQINVTTDGELLNVMKDENIYVIKDNIWDKSKFSMEPISKCEIGTLLSGKVAVIRVTRNGS